MFWILIHEESFRQTQTELKKHYTKWKVKPYAAVLWTLSRVEHVREPGGIPYLHDLLLCFIFLHACWIALVLTFMVIILFNHEFMICLIVYHMYISSITSNYTGLFPLPIPNLKEIPFQYHMKQQSYFTWLRSILHWRNDQKKHTFQSWMHKKSDSTKINQILAHLHHV